MMEIAGAATAWNEENMSSDSGEKSDWGVWLASSALVVILLAVLLGGTLWQWWAARSREAGRAAVVPTQTLMQPIRLADAKALQTLLDTLPGRPLSDAMAMLHLPPSAAIAHPNSTACYNIVVEAPQPGMLKLMTADGVVTTATFKKH